MNGFVLVLPFPPPPEGGGGGGGLRQFSPADLCGKSRVETTEKGKQQHPFSLLDTSRDRGPCETGRRRKRLLVRQTRISQTICTAKKNLSRFPFVNIGTALFLRSKKNLLSLESTGSSISWDRKGYSGESFGCSS